MGRLLPSPGDRGTASSGAVAALVQALGQAMIRRHVAFPALRLVPSAVQPAGGLSPGGADVPHPAGRRFEQFESSFKDRCLGLAWDQEEEAMPDAATCLIRLVDGLEPRERAAVLPAALVAHITLMCPHVDPREGPGHGDDQEEARQGAEARAFGSAQRKRVHECQDGDSTVCESEPRNPASEAHSLQGRMRAFLLGNTFLRLLERLPLGPADALPTLALEAVGGEAGGGGGLQEGGGGGAATRPLFFPMGSAWGRGGDGKEMELRRSYNQQSVDGSTSLRLTNAGAKFCELAWILQQELADPGSTTCSVTWDCLRGWAQGLEGEEAQEFANVEARHARMLGLPF